jgi:succinate-semialdehyde dehydrogenase/glutarate-semialdehyde dehydrogenase
MIKSINPATANLIRAFLPHSAQEIAERIEHALQWFELWKTVDFDKRAGLLRKTATILHERQHSLASLMADEMGKVLKDGQAEIAKCAWVCEYYAEHGASFLKDIPIPTDASNSFVTFQPLGIILGIMPWNFPFWQVFRFAIPTLMAGNVVLVKHSSNVMGCALAIEEVFRDAGFPRGSYSSLILQGDSILPIIDHPAIKAVTLTGSAEAGRQVAARAGAMLKKTVMELGGSDPYIILEDADIPLAAQICAQSRLINCGQSCIAAKRFIVLPKVRKKFEELMIDYLRNISWGNPHDPTTDVGPLARADLRDHLHHQVYQSIALGASLRLGGFIPEHPGSFYPPTVITDVRPGMPVFDEETFGPVAAIIEAKNEEEALALANQPSYGLGASIFTKNSHHGEDLALNYIEAGQVFVNTFVKSDPRLPFGGTKSSGYGRELGLWGIREFVNVKTIYVA